MDRVDQIINKVGSLINGPILAAFLLAIWTKRATDIGATAGILAGFMGYFVLMLLVLVGIGRLG